MRVRRFLVCVAFAACHRFGGSSSASDAGTASSVGDAAPSTETTIESLLPKALADTPPFGNDNRRAVCGKTITGTCDILRTKSAGTDAQGRNLLVVTVRTQEPHDGGAGSLDFENGIEQREHWVIGTKDGVIVFRARLASEFARAEVGVDEALEVRTNEVGYVPMDVSPSSWKGSASLTFRLSPLAILTAANGQYNTNPQRIGSSDGSIDFRDGSGEGSFHCSTRDGKYFPIPALGRIVGFDPSRGFGKCAGDVDGTPRHGTLLKGPADRQNGWFRVAYMGSSLYVEVHDDHFTAGDRLEMRVGRGASGMLCDSSPATVTKKITIDGAGSVSQKGVIDVKRIRNEPTARTFEIVFSNPKSVDVWSGLALDMIDDDGGAVRRLSTAAIGPELGTTVDVSASACVNGPDGPVPVPLAEETSLSLAAAPTIAPSIAAVVRAWNDATNAHDAGRLGALYANEVDLYGTKMTRERATALKNAAFARHDHDTLGQISVTKNRATFSKTSRAKDGSTVYVDGYIDVNASMQIIAEGDTTTDENLARKRETDCLTAIDALLAATPEGKKARALGRRSVDNDGPHWTLTYFSQRPGSAKEDKDFVIGDEFEIDAASAVIQHDGTPMVAPAMTTVAAACK